MTISPFLMRRAISATQGVGLRHEGFALPVPVGLGLFLGLALEADEFRVGGEVLEALALEILKGLETVFLHEGEEFLFHRVDQLIAMLQDAGADLHSVGTQKNELRSVVTGLDATNAGQSTAGNSLRIMVAISMHMRRAIGRMAFDE